MTGFAWLLVPLAPCVGLVLLRWQDRVIPWLWLSCVPALLLACWPAQPSSFSLLWPGTRWGADDLMARGFLGFSALLWGCATIFAAVSERSHPRRQKFWLFWLLSLSGNLLLVIAQDAASFYVGFSVMSLAAYGLVVHLGGPGPRQAGRVYLQLAVLGEMLLYAGIMLRIHEAGGAIGAGNWGVDDWSFIDWGFDHWQSVPIGGLTAILLLLGFGLKAGFWPLHVWLPLAHPAAPAAASAVLSGAMIKAGILGIWRFTPVADAGLQSWAIAVFAIAMFSVFYGALMGVIQTRAKAALAYSSVSQVGFLLAIVALAWLQPGAREAWAIVLVLYTVHHGLAKGALFLGAGLSSHYAMRRMHWLLLALPALALAGLPFTSGAAVKLLLKDGIAATPLVHWLPLLSLGSVATGLVVARALWLMYQTQCQLRQDAASRRKPPPGMLYPWLLLSTTPLLLAVLLPAMRSLLPASLELDKLWALLWPILLTAGVVIVALRRGWRLPARLTHLPNPARHVSLRLKRLLLRPPVPDIDPVFDLGAWRRRERRWNRFWQQGTVAVSVWLICAALLASLLVGWLVAR